MYILTVEDNFSSAHQLREYKGKCENLHGHNWKVIVSIKGEKLNSIGLLIDFKDLKTMLKEILTDIDHININDVAPFDKINPSSENIARYISERLSTMIIDNEEGIEVESVTVWESDTSRCTYIPS
jgi:6-pyruvoyltetrahydropterin/6-carboxytetrahydropterin synthase